MRLVRPALDRVRHDERGSSLVEMMVVIVLMSLILGAVSSTMILGQRQAGSSVIRLDNSAQTRIGMEAMSKVLRTAVNPSQLAATFYQFCTNCGTTMVIAADATSITFYANVNNDQNTASVGGSKVTYSVVQDPVKLWGNLVEQVQAPTAGFPYLHSFCTPGPGCPVRSRVVARGLVWPVAAPPLFTYYNASDAVLASPLTAGTLGQVDSIDVALRVRTSTAYGTPSTTLVQRIVLTNASLIP